MSFSTHSCCCLILIAFSSTAILLANPQISIHRPVWRSTGIGIAPGGPAAELRLSRGLDASWPPKPSSSGAGGWIIHGVCAGEDPLYARSFAGLGRVRAPRNNPHDRFRAEAQMRPSAAARENCFGLAAAVLSFKLRGGFRLPGVASGNRVNLELTLNPPAFEEDSVEMGAFGLGRSFGRR